LPALLRKELFPRRAGSGCSGKNNEKSSDPAKGGRSMNKNKTNSMRELVTYCCLWVASLVLYFWAIPTQVILRGFAWTADVGFDAQTLPTILAVCLFFVTTLGIIKTLPIVLKARKERIESGQPPQKNQDGLYATIIPLLMFLACVLFITLFMNFGFFIAALIGIPILLTLLRAKKWYYYAIAYGFAGLLFVVFRLLLNVPLPY